MFVTPAETPVTTPVTLTVAIVVLPEVQVPPGVASVKVIVAPEHTLAGPDIESSGKDAMVTETEVKHPVPMV